MKTKTKKVIRWIGIAVLLIVTAIQFIPVDRTNPAVETEVAAPEPVRAILRRACFDCHSNETVWPFRQTGLSQRIKKVIPDLRRPMPNVYCNSLDVKGGVGAQASFYFGLCICGAIQFRVIHSERHSHYERVWTAFAKFFP